MKLRQGLAAVLIGLLPLSAGCFKLGGLDGLLTYDVKYIENENARDIMRKKGAECVRKGNLCDAEIAFRSIKDYAHLEELALIYADNTQMKGCEDIYVFLEDQKYPARPEEEVLKNFSLEYEFKNK